MFIPLYAPSLVRNVIMTITLIFNLFLTLFFKGFLKSENELLFLLPRIGCIAVGPREIHLQCFDQKEGFPNCNNEL